MQGRNGFRAHSGHSLNELGDLMVVISCLCLRHRSSSQEPSTPTHIHS